MAHDPNEDEDIEARWLELRPPDVSPDFVERTLRRVMASLRDSRDELAPTEDTRLPADLLAAWRTPPASASFVADTLDRVLEDRSFPGLRQVLDRHQPPEPTSGFVDRTARLVTSVLSGRFDAALRHHVVPEPTADFVDGTLSRLHRSGTTAPSAPRRARWRRLLPVMALAATLLVTLGIAILSPNRHSAVVVPAAYELGPAPLSASVFAAVADERERAFTVGDGLALLARVAQEGE